MKALKLRLPYSHVVTTGILVLALCLCATVHGDPPDASSSGGSTQEAEQVSQASGNETSATPPLDSAKASSIPWWAAGLGFVLVAAVILYFILANMERKTTDVFETTIIDDIMAAIMSEYDGLKGDKLRDLIATVVADHRCDDQRLNNLLRIEYEVEKVDSGHVKRTTAVAVRKDGNLVLKKTTRTLAWEDLPQNIRSEFILKKENVLVYSLYTVDGKDG